MKHIKTYESLNEGKNSAVWTSPKTGKSYDIQKNGNRWEMDIMKKGSSIYDKVTTIKRKTPQELKDWLEGYKIDSKWMEHLLESINEAKDNLYLQLHRKYAQQIQGLKAKKIKKLTDLVSVQRWSMEDRDDYFDMDPKKKKELSAEYNEERKLFKRYMARDHSVMLPKGTETLAESVNEAAADITSDQLDKFLKSKFKNKGDKETYDIVITSQDSRDDDEEDDYVTDVAIGYDVHTKAGHVRAEDDVFFDLDQQMWFDNWGSGGDMKSLPNVEKIIKKHIRDNKKQITG